MLYSSDVLGSLLELALLILRVCSSAQQHLVAWLTHHQSKAAPASAASAHAIQQQPNSELQSDDSLGFAEQQAHDKDGDVIDLTADQDDGVVADAAEVTMAGLAGESSLREIVCRANAVLSGLQVEQQLQGQLPVQAGASGQLPAQAGASGQLPLQADASGQLPVQAGTSGQLPLQADTGQHATAGLEATCSSQQAACQAACSLSNSQVQGPMNQVTQHQQQETVHTDGGFAADQSVALRQLQHMTHETAYQVVLRLMTNELLDPMSQLNQHQHQEASHTGCAFPNDQSAAVHQLHMQMTHQAACQGALGQLLHMGAALPPDQSAALYQLHAQALNQAVPQAAANTSLPDEQEMAVGLPQLPVQAISQSAAPQLPHQAICQSLAFALKLLGPISIQALHSQLPNQAQAPLQHQQQLPSQAPKPGLQLPDQALTMQQAEQQLPDQAPPPEQLQQQAQEQLPDQDAASQHLQQQAQEQLLDQDAPPQQEVMTDDLVDEEVVTDDLEDLCMLCAYGMDLAAALGCLLEQVQDWAGMPFGWMHAGAANQSLHQHVMQTQTYADGVDRLMPRCALCWLLQPGQCALSSWAYCLSKEAHQTP